MKSDKPDTGLATLEDLGQRYSVASLETLGKFERAIRLAEGVSKLRQALDPFMPQLMALAGTRLGFLTDRDKSDKGPYPVGVVKECIIEATLKGLLVIGNQFNIIAGNQYTTKEGYTHLLRNLVGLTDLRPIIGVPRMRDGGCIVACKAIWRFNGKADSLERDFGVKTNAGGGVDQAVGKAERKLLAAIYKQITGSEHTDDADDVVGAEALPVPTQTERVKAMLEDARKPLKGSPEPVGNGEPYIDDGRDA